jgi:ATP-dependent DNA helicase RecQ
LEKEPERRTLTLTQQGRNALRERRAFSFVQPRAVARTSKKRGAQRTAVAMAEAEELFQHLRTLRKSLADEQGVPPYVVFSDATLREIAANKPATLSAFRAIGGVGDAKLERYGQTFLDALASFHTSR